MRSPREFRRQRAEQRRRDQLEQPAGDRLLRQIQQGDQDDNRIRSRGSARLIDLQGALALPLHLRRVENRRSNRSEANRTNCREARRTACTGSAHDALQTRAVAGYSQRFMIGATERRQGKTGSAFIGIDCAARPLVGASRPHIATSRAECDGSLVNAVARCNVASKCADCTFTMPAKVECLGPIVFWESS